jgi:hypothetical protein
MLFMTRLELSCFADFFEWIFKTRVASGFLSNPLVEIMYRLHGEIDSSLLSNRCPRIPPLVTTMQAVKQSVNC